MEMKKSITIILVLVLTLIVAAVGGYFYYETTMVEPLLSMETSMTYNSISGSYEIEVNDAVINFEEAVVGLYRDDELVTSKPVSATSGEFVFNEVKTGEEYEVKISFNYTYEYYKSVYETELSVNENPQFTKEWGVAPTLGIYSPLSLIGLNDGCLLYGGYHYNGVNTDVFFSKYDLNGEVIWSYDMELEGYSQVSSVIENGNNDIVISVVNYKNETDTVFLVLDANGNEKETVMMRDLIGKYDFRTGYYPTLVPTDGGFVFAQKYPNNFNIYSVDKDFNLVINKSIEIDFDDIQDNRLLPYKDGFILVYNYRVNDTRNKIEVLYLDQEGNTIWNSSIYDENHTSFTDVFIDGDSIVILGSSSEMIIEGNSRSTTISSFLSAFDSEGDQTWRTNFDDLNYAAISKIGVLDDDTYFMVGNGYTKNDEDYSFATLDKEGKVLNTMFYLHGVYHNFAFVSDGIVFGAVVDEDHHLIKIH
jgi:hypothetical protein